MGRFICFGILITALILTVRGTHDVRLVDGASFHHGRVEVLRNEQWYTVCHDYMSYYYYYRNVPKVVCRMMFGASYILCNQYPNYYWYDWNWYSYGVYYSTGSGPAIDVSHCTGTETSIFQCSFTHVSDCSPALWMDFLYMDPSLVPPWYWDNFPLVRLSDGPSQYNGRLEVYYHGNWGTVCDDDFGRNEADVVCRMLGFKNPIGFVYKGAIYGWGSSYIFFDKINCTVGESTLLHCQLTRHEDGRCSHSEDVGILCAEELTFALSVGAAVLFPLIIGAIVTAVYIVRRRMHRKINCATAALDATKWDLLLVVDTKDALTKIAIDIIDALSMLNPKPKVRRTPVHRLRLHENQVQCKRAMFILCNVHTTTEQCCKYLLPKLGLKGYSASTIRVLSFDIDCLNFEEFKVTKDGKKDPEIIPIDQAHEPRLHNWQVPFIKMYFESRENVDRFFCKTILSEENPYMQKFNDTLTSILDTFGIRDDASGDKSSFRLVIKASPDEETPTQSNGKQIPVFTFVKTTRKQMMTEDNSRIFSKDEMLRGMLCILSESMVIRQKYSVRKTPVIQLV